MARRIGPDQAERVFYYTSGARKGVAIDSGTPVPLYADVQCSLPADVLSLDGSPIAGTIPTVMIGDTLEVPLFQFPDTEDPEVYTRILGGPVVALHPSTDGRLDALGGRVTAIEPGGSAAALRAGQNLSELASAATARTNLGLGGAATLSVGTTAGTVAAGNDARLSDQRTPSDGSVTDAKVASGANIAQSKIANLTSDLAAKLPTSSAATVISQQMLTPEQFGAAGNGITDDTAALVAWLAAGNTGIALRPGCKYLTSVPLTLPGTVKTLAGNGATIAATNNSGSPILAKTSTGTVSNLRISDVTFDCASHMDGPRLVAISQSALSGVIVLNPILTGLTIGDATGTKSNGNRLYDVRVEFDVQPANSVGLLLAKANDTHVVSLEVLGAYTGVLIDSQSSGGIFFAPHVWGLTANLPNTCYDISGATTMFHPHADTPSAVGYRFRANSPHRLVEPEIFVNPSYGLDNTVTAIMLDDFVNLSITGPQFIGGDATHRIAADISGPMEFVKASNPYYFQTVIQRLVPTPLRRTWQPEYSGFKGWTCDPAAVANVGTIPTQGTMQVIRLPWQPGEKVSTIYTSVVTAGAGLTAGQCLLGVYDMSGNLLGTTQNAATTWQSTGLRTHAMNTPARCNDSFVDVAFFWNGTTGPTLLRGSSAGIGAGTRYATADTGLTTALPATMGTRNSAFNSWWVAVA